MLMSLIVALSAVTEPPDHWYPPAPQSECWGRYNTCTANTYRDYLDGLLTAEELQYQLGLCRNILGWCALLEWLDEQLAADLTAALGPDETAEALAQYFAG